MVSTETIYNNLDSQVTLSILSSETALLPWSIADYRDHVGTGYVQRFRNSSYQTAETLRIVQEVEQVGFYEAIETEYEHTFLISVYSDFDGMDKSADLLTTFGVDVTSGVLVAGELINPSLDLNDHEVQERLAQYELKGITVRSEAEQRQYLDGVLGMNKFS